MTTGSESLDRILGNGVPRGALMVIAGHPGTGKTVLAQQTVFANATPEQPALYLTTFSEPLPKVVRYLEGFAFFDPERMYNSVDYCDLGQRVEEEGIEALPDLVTGMLQERAADLVVIDSFKALHDLGTRPDVFRMVVFRLARAFASLGVTALWLGEYDETETARYPEFAVADAVVELANRSHGVRDERTIRVLKMRGGEPLPGEHTFTIKSNGLNVFPRLIGADPPKAATSVPERVPTWVDGLDEMIDGGVWRGSSTLVLGPAGSGKTTLGVSFLVNGAGHGENGLFVTLHETPDQIRAIVAGFWPGAEAMLEERIIVQHYTALEVSLVEVLQLLKDVVASGRVSRIVIDSVRDLRDAAIDPSRLRATIYNLIHFCSAHRIVVLINAETPILSREPYADPEGISSMVDNVVVLEFLGEERRDHGIAVVKTRRSAHDSRTHGVGIDAGGFHVGAPTAD